MRSTYARTMTGDRIAAPPIRKRWVYLLVATLLIAMGAMAPRESIDLLTDPVGLAAALGIIAGFAVRKSMALTPWVLVSVALIFYGPGKNETVLGTVSQVAQLLALAMAMVVCAFQLRVRLVSGSATLRPPRAQWGSVLVALTAASVVITLGFPRVPLVLYVRGASNEMVISGPAILPSRYGRALQVGRVSDPSLTEISGLGASHANPGVLWAHNDSGHPPALYCLEPSGVSCGSWDVLGAENYDWEDIDIGPGPIPERSYLYVGDIGDNSRVRDTLTVYRMPEPLVDLSSPTSAPGSSLSVSAEAIQFRYPDGPHDAETLLIHPRTGDLYIVTKDLVSGVYKAPAPLDPGEIMTLKRVARFSIFANLADCTGGDISPDGERVVVATYGGAYELVLPPDSTSPGGAGFNDIWQVTPARIDTGKAAQLEAVTYSPDGSSVLFVAEGERSPISESHLKPKPIEPKPIEIESFLRAIDRALAGEDVVPYA